MYEKFRGTDFFQKKNKETKKMQEETKMRLIAYVFACIFGLADIFVIKFIYGKAMILLVSSSLPAMDYVWIIVACIVAFFLSMMFLSFFLIIAYGEDATKLV